MSAAELEPPSTAPTLSHPHLHPHPHPRPRLRHELRDEITAAGLALAASVAVTGLVWVGLWWLG